MMEMRDMGYAGSFGCPITAFAEGIRGNTGCFEGPLEDEARMHLKGRGSAGLWKALAPFLAADTLTPRELRLLTDLMLFETGAPGAGFTPELDLIGDTAELWLFDAHSEPAYRRLWRLIPDVADETRTLPANELERLLTLRAYLLELPDDPARDALLADCEARISRLTGGRVARACRRASSVC